MPPINSDPGFKTKDVIPAAQWDNIFGGKVDAQGGQLDSATLTGTFGGDWLFSGNVAAAGTGAFGVPVGTTGQQPNSGLTGQIRYNSDTGRYEFGIGSAWKNHVRLDGDTMSGTLAISGTLGTIASGTVAFGSNATNGGVLTGKGATNDVTIQNGSGSNALFVLSGTTTVRLPNANSNKAALTINGGGSGGFPTGGLGLLQIANTAPFSGAIGSGQTAYLSSILFNGDTLDASSATGTDVTGMQISLVSGGSGMKGGRIALGTTFRLTTGSSSTSSKFYQAFAPNIRIEANDGGTSGNTRASAFAMNPIATIGGGATFTDGPIAAEFDVSVEATVVTASLSGTVMTVTGVTSGTVAIGQVYSGSGVTPTTVTSLGTGAGGTGTYNMSVSQTVGSETLTGTNAPHFKKGISIVQLSTDSVAATSDEAAIEMVNQSGYTSPGWKNGIQFGGTVGVWPISPTGTLIGTQSTALGGPAYAAAYGVDLSAVAIGTAAFKSAGFQVSGTGSVVLAPTTALSTSSGPLLMCGDSVGANSNPLVHSYLVGSSSGALATIGFNAYRDSSGNTIRPNTTSNAWMWEHDLRNATGASLKLTVVSAGGAAATALTIDTSSNLTANTYKTGSNQVVGARVTGWGTGANGSKASLDASTATLAQTAAAVAQLITDLRTHGLIGT
jgi:hypothetical protein